MTEATDTPAPIRCVLIAAGRFHDIDYARLEILKLLGEDQRVRVRVFEDYANLEAIRAADFLVTYTCDVTPSLEQQEVLRQWLEAGGRWYALHGTNSILRVASTCVETPDWAPHFMETLGTRFLSHPDIEPYTVNIAKPDHPLVAGISPFETTDELYLCETYGPVEVLLDVEYSGDIPDFSVKHFEHARYPVYYLKQWGKGAVLYLTLGHCRGHYDMQDFIPYWPTVERGSWDVPEYHELLRRGMSWSKRELDAVPVTA